MQRASAKMQHARVGMKRCKGTGAVYTCCVHLFGIDVRVGAQVRFLRVRVRGYKCVAYVMKCF